MRISNEASVLAIAAAMAVLASGAAVRAADMPEYPPIIEAPEPLPLPVGGWYLRGDIGYKIYNEPDARLSNSDFGDGTYTDGRGSLYDLDLDDSFNVGIGGGYRFNEWFRTDITLDYESPGSFSGKLYCPGCDNGNNDDNDDNSDGYTIEEADITAWSALANVYADLGTYYGITPYVGGGIGVSYLVTDDLRTVGGDSYDGDEKWNFAWALMAGASYALTQQMSLDVGYRYINLGDAKSGEISDGLGNSTTIDYDNLDAHEIRVGLRYNLY